MLSPRQDESGILIPLVLVETLWWCQAFQHNYFTYFPDRYKLSITMVSGLFDMLLIFDIVICQGFWSNGCWDDQWRWRSCCLPGATFSLDHHLFIVHHFSPILLYSWSAFIFFTFKNTHISTQVSHNALLQVMTLALGIAPTVARDFSVMIQSVGEHHTQIS